TAAHCSPDGQVVSSGLVEVLQHTADAILTLCGAHSAGINVLESDGGDERFRWLAAAGRWAVCAGGIMPRNSPSGAALGADAALLTASPAQHNAWGIAPPVVEALVVPFHLGGQPVGTLWTVSHDDGRRFDAEDGRLLTSLGRIAANVC